MKRLSPSFVKAEGGAKGKDLKTVFGEIRYRHFALKFHQAGLKYRGAVYRKYMNCIGGAGIFYALSN